ncbi:MAG TPA: hypothetical protein VE869_05515 [Gemmatimonas sp.]|nr:hypothetical protein [Gemmatimonas sp.]
MRFVYSLAALAPAIAPAIAALSAAALFGPPHIVVTAVSPAPAVIGAPAFNIEVEHHTTADQIKLTGRAEGVRGGQRVTLPLALVRRDSAHFTVVRQWEANTPWVLVFSVEQGPEGAHGVVEAVIPIDKSGAVRRIEYTKPGFHDGSKLPRRVTRARVDSALKELGVDRQE